MTPAERAALILKIRRQQDPCLRMPLTPTQQRANSCKARYIAVRGSNRSGKTAWSAKKLATIARQLPDVKTTSVTGVYIVFAPSREQIQSPWAKKLLEGSELPGDLYERPFIPDYEIEHISYTYGAGDPTVKAITLKNGNKIIFCVSGDKNVWKRLEGKALLGAVLDESAGTEKLLTELMARLLDANSHPVVQQEAGGAWIIWGATQTKKSPAFEQFLSICQSDAPEHGDYAAFTLVADENPSVSMEERQKLAVMMSEDEYKIRMEGHGSAASAMAVYPQWNDERNLVQGPDYIPGPEDNIWWFFDPGAHYAGIVLAAINKEHPHRLNVFKCIQPQRATLEQCVKMVRDELGGRALEGVVYDQAARKKEMSGRSAISEMAQIITRKGYDIKIHRGLMMGRSNYKDTVPLVRQYLCTPPNYPDYPTKIILNRTPESGCQLLRWQIMNVAFKENDYELKEENISKGNDHCLAPGTKVLTPNGVVNIEDIKPGIFITNRFGDYQVLLSIKSSNKKVYTIKTQSTSMTVTGNHPVLTSNGWKRVDSLNISDTLLVCKQLNTTAILLDDTLRDALSQTENTTELWSEAERVDGASICIGLSGKTYTVQSPQDIISIIKMETQIITNQEILNASQDQSIPANTVKKDGKTIPIEQNNLKILTTLDHSQKLGTPAQKENNGIDTMGLKPWNTANRKPLTVDIVRNPFVLSQDGQDSVQITVKAPLDEHQELITLPESVCNVQSNSQQINTQKHVFVLEPVLDITEQENLSDVYCLTILGPPEFIADGFTVANCSDALRYGVSRKPTYIYRGQNLKLWGEGTNGQDPDGDVHRFYKSTSGDIHIDQKPEIPQTPGQRFAAKRAKRLQQQRQKKRRW